MSELTLYSTVIQLKNILPKKQFHFIFDIVFTNLRKKHYGRKFYVTNEYLGDLEIRIYTRIAIKLNLYMLLYLNVIRIGTNPNTCYMYHVMRDELAYLKSKNTYPPIKEKPLLEEWISKYHFYTVYTSDIVYELENGVNVRFARNELILSVMNKP